MIEIQAVTQRFGNVEAVRNVDLSIRKGEIFGIIGRSGAGKSTLVRTLNLLNRPTSGRIVLDGQDLTSLSSSQLREARRGIGMIFQHFNLLSSRSVYDNIALPLELAGKSKSEIAAKAEPLLELVGLTALRDRYPAQISGGQKQRVGIARALANDPKVLLSDAYRKTTLSLWGTYFMGLLVIYLLSGWLPTLIKDAGLPIEKAASITALFQLGGTVGALVVGFLMDRWSPSRAIACAYIAGAVFILLLASGSVQSGMFAAYVLLAGFCMSGAQTGLNAFAPSCYPTVVRATGVSWMLGVGRFGSILGSFAGGVLLSMGWGFGAVIAILAVPATLAALIIVFIQMGQRPAAAV